MSKQLLALSSIGLIAITAYVVWKKHPTTEAVSATPVATTLAQEEALSTVTQSFVTAIKQNMTSGALAAQEAAVKTGNPIASASYVVRK